LDSGAGGAGSGGTGGSGGGTGPDGLPAGGSSGSGTDAGTGGWTGNAPGSPDDRDDRDARDDNSDRGAPIDPAAGVGPSGPDGQAPGGSGPWAGGPAGSYGDGAGSEGAGPGTTGGDSSTDGTSSSGGGGGGWGAMAAALEALGLDGGPPALRVLPTLVGTSGAVAMAMAFAIFGKKRRDEEPPAPDEVLQAQAARGTGYAATAELARGIPAPFDEEALMPRWRRPSLLEARKADPARTVVTSPRLSFDDGRVHPIDGRERRIIRYRVVRLLDAPDELRSVDIGQLDQGDEVQLLERSGAYWLVLCPDGRQGWLHKMTLGEVVSEETAPTSDDWQSSEMGTDILAAYLAARARA
jgi:hypothetical protein